MREPPGQLGCSLIGALLAVAALSQPVSGGEVARWTDANGRVNYGDRAPAGSAGTATGIRTRVPAAGDLRRGPCQTVQCQYDRLRNDRLREDREWRANRDVTERLAAARPSARGMSFETFSRLDRGMTEAELFSRAGTPDYQSFDGAVGSKVWTYYPTASDPFTTSVILRGGQIFELERVRSF